MRCQVQTQWDSKHKNEPLLCFVHVSLMQEGFTQLMCTGSTRLMTSAMVKEQRELSKRLHGLSSVTAVI